MRTRLGGLNTARRQIGNISVRVDRLVRAGVGCIAVGIALATPIQADGWNTCLRDGQLLLRKCENNSSERLTPSIVHWGEVTTLVQVVPGHLTHHAWPPCVQDNPHDCLASRELGLANTALMKETATASLTTVVKYILEDTAPR